MSQENEAGHGSGDHTNSSGPRGGGSRLPPPAFPPGARRVQYQRAATRTHEELGEAFISPDEPLPERTDPTEGAFISPDDPLPERGAAGDEAFISPDDPIPPREEEGVVTGMGFDEHLDPEEVAMGGDPHVMELSHKIEKLSAALKRKGEAGLRTAPDMDRFDTTLRAYCVGYLAGRRAEDAE